MNIHGEIYLKMYSVCDDMLRYVSRVLTFYRASITLSRREGLSNQFFVISFSFDPPSTK